MHAERASLIRPTGRLIVEFLSKHPAFDGLDVGKAKAARLCAEFGPDLDALLSRGDVEKLSGLLAAKSAQRLVKVWLDVAEEAGVVSFLDDHGFDVRLVNKVRRTWSEAPLAKLQENPYWNT